MSTNFGNYRKSVHVPPESLFTFNQNWCSPSAGITVHLAPEYAPRPVGSELNISALLGPKTCVQVAKILTRINQIV